MGDIEFLLNGEPLSISGEPPTRTLLDWLRETRGLTGTKEGCNEGDCGACTVMVRDEVDARALNACILFLPQLNGTSVTTVEGLESPDGTPHPVQTAMVDHHASQCGFCTPGFAVSMATAHLNGATDHDDQLAGNLCRCTGYAPIIRAAIASETAPVPKHLQTSSVQKYPWGEAKGRGADSPHFYTPQNSDDLASWYLDHPDATLIAGATDVGLWVTKQLRDLKSIAFLSQCTDLKAIEDQGDSLRIGAMVNMNDVRDAVTPFAPSYGEMIRRYGSQQVRNAATIGGNIANGSPIGDNPPALIVLGATLHLRRGSTERNLPIEDFFLDYGKQDRAPGEFVSAITLPKAAEDFAVYKISKRFDQDISAVCGAFNISQDNGVITSARIAYGGMAGTPKRAFKTETALIGQPADASSAKAVAPQLEEDFTPLSDMRASALYRQKAALGLLERFFLEKSGHPTSVLEVSP